MIIKYEEVVDDYNSKLLTKLRSHASSLDYLEMWVPDEDPVKSILNMVEAAEAYGQQEIKIQVKKGTLINGDVGRLSDEIEKIATLEIRRNGDEVLFDVTRLQQNTSGYFDDIHSCFHKEFSVIAEQFYHFGNIEIFSGEEMMSASEDGVSLYVSLKDGVIVRATFDGEMKFTQKIVMEAFCRYIAEMPLQESADHAALNVLYKLYDKTQGRPVSGILMVNNVDPVFKTPEILIRRINKEYIANKKITDLSNFWNPQLSKDWLMLSEKGKAKRILPIIETFLEEQGLTKSDVGVVEITKDIRVTLYVNDEISVNVNPKLLLDLEARLRDMTGKRLEIYMEEKQDGNRIRRIKLD